MYCMVVHGDQIYMHFVRFLICEDLAICIIFAAPGC